VALLVAFLPPIASTHSQGLPPFEGFFQEARSIWLTPGSNRIWRLR